MNKINIKFIKYFYLIICLLLPAISYAANPNSNLKVKKFDAMVGSMPNFFKENIYLLIDNETKQVAIVDPGNRSRDLEDYIANKGLTVSMILNTHGHHDHVGANDYYSNKYGVNVFVSYLDEDFYAGHFSDSSVAKDLNIIDQIKFGSREIKVIKNPGHTPGSVSFLIENVLFSGDTLFKGSIGRTWGILEEKKKTQAQEIANIKNKLLALPDSTKVYPGHGEPTTIGYERANNKFLVD